MDLFTWGAAIRFISRRRVCSGPSLGRLFLRASSRKAVHCCTIFCSMNTSTIWAVSASGSSSWHAILGRSILHQCCGSMTFWCGSGSADPCLWLMDPDPVLFSSLTFKMPTKKYLFKKKKLFCLLLFEATFALFFKDKTSKRRHKAVGIKVLLTIFCLVMEGSGSRRPKNIRIRICNTEFNKRLQSFAPCYSHKSILMADFNKNHTLLWVE